MRNRWIAVVGCVLASGVFGAGAPRYAVHLSCEPLASTIEQGRIVEISCVVTNRSDVSLDSDRGILFSYHVFDNEGRLLRWDNERSRFASPILPGRAETVRLTIQAPALPGVGSYRITPDIVEEGVAWYSAQGADAPALSLRIVPMREERFVDSQLLAPSRTVINSRHPLLNRLWHRIEIVFANTRRQLAFAGRDFVVNVAGSGYPQAWIRDCNTVLPGALWLADRKELLGCLRVHFTAQRVDGYVYDWVDGAGNRQKNTVETDQEASLVQMLGTYVLATDDKRFLDEVIAGKTALNRADAALDYLWWNKRDRSTGLLVGGHTIDWGDVEIGKVDRTAVLLDERSTLTIDIYDQAMFVLAAPARARLHDMKSAKSSKGALWRGRATQVVARTRKLLWNDASGYFVMHRHVTPLVHPFDEDALFPMGGNAMAIESGIATPEMALQIFDVALTRQREYRMSTISGVLLPPYARGIYQHPMVVAPFQYQNGGQWDWFGARLILAMYRAGYSELATSKLLEIAAKVDRNGGIFEWESPDGTPGGSSDYVGAAGMLARALIEGYFGVTLEGHSATLTVRPIGTREGIIAWQPATGEGVGYEYVRDDADGKVTFKIYPYSIGVKTAAFVRAPDTSGEPRIRVNGRQVPTLLRKVGADAEVAFKLPVGVEASPLIVTVER